MIDSEKIIPMIKGYKEYFPEHWKNEKYKWEAVKHFQDNWDIEAENFGAMFKKATDKTSNLLGSGYAYPRGMILNFADADDDAVREMFRNLYDESIDLTERMNAFMEKSEELRDKYNDGTWNQHYQNTNYISTYLWLMYPDKYYIYKYELFKKCAEMLDDTYRPKGNGSVDNVIGGFKMYDEIREALLADDDIREMLDSVLTDSCYADPELVTATIDFGFYLARFYHSDISQCSKDKSFQSSKTTWLFTWDPDYWEWDSIGINYSDLVNKTQKGENVVISWSCTRGTTSIGDNVFLIKTGRQKKRGIVAKGYIISNEQILNEDDIKHDRRYVDVNFTKFIDYNTSDLITMKLIHQTYPEQELTSLTLNIKLLQSVEEWIDEYWENPSLFITKSIYDSPIIWKISEGTSRNGVPEHLRTILENRKVVTINKYTGPSAGSKISQGNMFMDEIKKGDYFFLCYSGEIVLLGQFLEDKPELNQEMVDYYDDFDWYERSYRLIAHSIDHNKYTGKKKAWTSNYNSTCVKVTDNELFEKLILQPYFGLKLSDLNVAEFHEPYTKADFLKEVFLTEPEYDKLRSLVLRKKNIILQGAPGVGKTFSAKRLAYSIIGEKNENRICMVQFHQNYSYEDFIMGYRPNDNGGFELQSGVFYNFCIRCKENPDKPYFFIIDEINRGNLSKIFGELLMLIETDKRGEKHKLNLVYGGTAFYIPENLHIIGMMNTADRSLAMIDYALRRRFSFYTMQPAFENADQNGFGAYTQDISCDLYHSVIAKIRELNDTIRKDSTLGKGFEIGHSYFAPENKSDIDDEWVRGVVEYEIIPLIEEYWFDDDKKVEEWTKALYQALGD